jgi:hypothetical protein
MNCLKIFNKLVAPTAISKGQETLYNGFEKVFNC